MKPTPWLIVFAIRVYCFLMRLYPASYRDAVGSEEIQVFRTQCRETYRHKSSFGVIRISRLTGLDLVRGAVAERLMALVMPNSTDPPLTPQYIIRFLVIALTTALLSMVMVLFPGTPLYLLEGELTNLHMVEMLILLACQVYSIRMVPRINRGVLRLEQKG